MNFDTNDKFIATITAPNGSGKSSILEAITTALFYRARGVDSRGTGMDDLINNECDFFEITLEFVMDNNDYKIIRKKTRGGKHELEFFINNVSQTEKINDTQDKINKVIKMNYDTFLDTVCIGQGKSDNFMKKKPNERKDVFVEILNLNQFEVLEKHTKDLKKELSTQLIEKENTLYLLQDSVNKEAEYNTLITQYSSYTKDFNNKILDKEIELKKVREEKAQYDLIIKQNEQLLNHKKNIYSSINNTKNKISATENKVNSFNVKINNLKVKFVNNKKNIVSYQESIKEYEEELNSIVIEEINDDKTSINNQIEEILQQKNDLETEKTQHLTNIKSFKNQIAEYKIQYNNLNEYNKGECEFCGNEITAEHKEKHLNDLIKKINTLTENIEENNKLCEEIVDKVNELKTKYVSCKNALNNIDEKVKEINKLKIRQEKLNSAISNYTDKISSLKEEMAEIKEQKTEYDNEIISLNKEIEDLRNELSDFNKQYEECSVDEIETKIFNDGELEFDISTLRDKLVKAESNKAVYEEKIVEINNNKQKLNEVVKEIEDITTQISDYESLIEAFGKKGIQANIIANVLPDVENEINEVLDALFNNSTTIEFITQKDDKKTKAKKEISLETLDIVIHDKDRDRNYETYSGGEKFRIDFACHIGMAKFLAKRAKANIEFFMIDEGLGSQDDEGRENFILTVNKLSDMFKQIFIITHIDEVKDAFDKKIVINKDNIKGSKIEVL
jgi:exonuclease SbcC